MVFASLEFLSLFLPLFLGAYAWVKPARRNALLLFGSWLFYGWWSPTFLLMFIGLAGLGWIGGLVIARFAEGRGRGLAAAAIRATPACCSDACNGGLRMDRMPLRAAMASIRLCKGRRARGKHKGNLG